MILIYTQSTIDYMHKVNPSSLVALEKNHGVPEIKEFMSKNGDNIRYYVFVDKQ